MLTKQQKLDVLSKAIDEGAIIDIHYHGLSRSNAASLTKGISNMIEVPVERKSKAHAYWYQIRYRDFGVTAFYDHK